MTHTDRDIKRAIESARLELWDSEADAAREELLREELEALSYELSEVECRQSVLSQWFEDVDDGLEDGTAAQCDEADRQWAELAVRRQRVVTAMVRAQFQLDRIADTFPARLTR